MYNRNMLTNEELKNILVLINKSNITGQEAVVVALLQQKISLLLKEEPKTEPTKDLPKAEK